MGTPALFTRQSRWPKASHASSATRPASSTSPRSATHIRESGASTRQSARTSARRSSRRATSPTVAPLRASAAPIPDDAPVTSTRDPSIFMGASSGRFLGARSGSVDHGSRNTTMAILDDIRRFWDDDAATYDDAPGHHPTSAAVQAAWTAALEALLPPLPSNVLDCGAGT